MRVQPATHCVLSTLLSNGSGAPAALLLNFHYVDVGSALALASHEDFSSLCAQFPCLILSSEAILADTDLAAALASAGCRQVEAGQIIAADKPLEAALPTGVDWVRGNWYLVAPAKPSAAQAASRALALQMVQLVLADADTHEIEALFRRDPALSYHLLRLVNSLGVGMGKKIASFAQAIVILGRQQLRRWLNLMLFSARDGDPRSPMLLARVAVRARQMELLAKACGLDRSTQELAFMGGMFSLLGILFGQPLEEVLRPLMISEALRSAVLEHEGDLGHFLALIHAFENGDLPGMQALLEEIQMPCHEFDLINIESHTWMLTVVRDSQGSANA